MKVPDASLWEAFQRVGKVGNFTRAAETLGVGTPLLSKKIARLEQALGVRLFQRSTRRVGLTEEGRALLPVVDSVLEDLRGLETRLEPSNTLSGTIRVSCLSGVAYRLLPPILSEFTRLHPAVRFDLDLSDRLVDLIETRTDLAIRIDRPESTELVYRKLASNELILCASPGYLKASRKPLRQPKDLFLHPVFMTGPVAGCRILGTRYRLADFIKAQPILCDAGLLLTELVMSGAGVGVRPRWDVHAQLMRRELVQVLPEYTLESWGDIFAVIPSRRFLAGRVRAFFDFLNDAAKTWEFQRPLRGRLKH